MTAGQLTDMQRFGPDRSDLWDASVVSADNQAFTLLAAQGTSVRAVITEITVNNPTETAVTVILLRGSTECRRLPAPAGGGCTINPLLLGNANEAWRVQLTSSLAGVYIAASGYLTQ